MSDLIRQTITPGATLQVQRQAGLFLLNEAAAPVRVRLYREGGVIWDASGLSRGVKIRPSDGFDRVDITNESGDPIPVEAFICAGDVDVQISTGISVTVVSSPEDPVTVAGPLTDAELRATPVNVIATGATLTATNVGTLSPDTFAAPVDVAIGAGARAQIVAAAGAGVQEREVIIKNLSANAALVRVGDAACDATHGHELMPGESITLGTRGAVHAWNTGAAPQSVSVLTNQRS